MRHKFYPLMPAIYAHSQELVLDIAKISNDLPEYQNIQKYFSESQRQGINPRLPEYRQRFNNEFLRKSGARYLIGSYAEDRSALLADSSIGDEGRTYHMGLDIFSENLETVFAPCDGEIVIARQDVGFPSFGYFAIIKPEPKVMSEYILLAHLAKELPSLGRVFAGEPIAKLADFKDGENGGWSLHLHVQLLTALPTTEELRIGYATKVDLERMKINYPDPSFLVFGRQEKEDEV